MLNVRMVLPFLVVAGLAPLARSQQTTYEEFVRQFNQTRELNDQKGVIKAIKNAQEQAIAHFKIQVDAYAQRNDTKAGSLVEEMRKLWTEAYPGSQLFDRIERSRSNLTPTELNMYQKLLSQRRVAYGMFESAKESKKEREFRSSIEGLQKIAESFEELGDKHEAAITWHFLLVVIEGFAARNKGDVELQVQAMERYLQHCEDWGWTQHRDYQVNKSWAKGLKASLENPNAGKKPDAKATDGNAAGLIPYKPGTKWATVDLAHSVAKKATEGVSLYASANPLYWLASRLEEDKPKELPLFQDGKIWLQRLGAAKFVCMTEPNGKQRDIRFGGTKKATELWYAKEDADGKYETNYKMFLWVGGNQQPWVNTTLNLVPSWKPNGGSRAVIFRRSASYFSADVAGEKVTLYDESGNGVFGEKAGSIRLNDLRLGSGLENPTEHVLIDSMRIGRGPLIPFSPYVQIGDAWYSIRAVKNNEQLRYRELEPAAIKPGKIVLKWKGPSKAKPKHLVVRAVSGAFVDALFDVASVGSKGVTVPAAGYEIFYGRTYSGRVPKNADAVILKGDSKAFEVKEGETHQLEMGTPFKIDFLPERNGDSITADSTKMWVVDKSGAKWTCLISEVLEPELVAAKDQKGRGARVLAEWRVLAGNEIQEVWIHYKKDVLTLAAYPVLKKGPLRYEVTVKNPHSGPSFVGLRQKKHKLFGRLGTVWK